jgi:transcriptional regulator with XRE-family HTH domain
MKNDDTSAPHPIDVAVGHQLRAIRKSKGLSQSQIGDGLGVTFQQVQKYERGTNRISASMLVKAARLLGVSPASILPADDAAEAPNPAIMALIAQMRGGEDLIQYYGQIRSSAHRRALVLLARAMAGEN